MSTASACPAPAGGRVTLPELAAKKQRGEPIVMVTAYDFPTGSVAEAAGVDLVLVGDTLAQTVSGFDGTVPVTMEEMIMRAGAVRRGAPTRLVIGDLPFGAYEGSDELAVASAQRFVKHSGCDAVKLERGEGSLPRARAISAAGIPVMGHLGVTPQSATALGGFRARGRTAAEALAMVAQAQALEAAGCFAVVLEAVPAPVAAEISRRLGVPVIGIGAGARTDGQVLVLNDLLGLFERPPRFVKRYADVRSGMSTAMARSVAEVRQGRWRRGGSSGQLYDCIGRGYVATRQADPRIAAAIHQALGDARSVVNVGAGAGAYEPSDRRVIAVEPSTVMIAQRPAGSAEVVQASAEALPFDDSSVDAAMAVLSDHHWADRARGLRELRRVARRRVVVFTWDPDMVDAFWLTRDYLPGFREIPGMSIDQIAECLDGAEVRPVPIPHDCRDGFLAAFWRRPAAYLDERVRAGISVFARLRAEEVAEAIGYLHRDLISGEWQRRNGHLLELDELDLGYRLVVAG